MSSAEDRLSQGLGHLSFSQRVRDRTLAQGVSECLQSGGGVRSQGVLLMGRLLLFRVGYLSVVCVPHHHCPTGELLVGGLWILGEGQGVRGARSQGVSLVGRLLLFRVCYSTSGCLPHSHCSTGYLYLGTGGHRKAGRGSEGGEESQVIAPLNVLVLTVHLRQRKEEGLC